MMRWIARDKTGFVVVFIVGLLMVFCGGILVCENDAQAEKCICESAWGRNNASINYACNHYTERAQGVIWINDSSDSNDVSTTVTIEDPNQKTVDVWLHGAVISKEGKDAGKATYINLVKYNGTINNQCIINGSPCVDYPALSGVPSEMDREGNKACDKDNDFRSSTKKLTLNLDEVKKETPTYSAGKKTYTVPIAVFRCYEGHAPGENSTSCFSSQSKLIVEYVMPKVTLRSWAYDIDGKTKLQSTKCDSQTIEIQQGKSGDATIGRCSTPKDYKFICWKDSLNGQCKAYGDEYTKTISEDTDVYAIYEGSRYEGRTSVSGGTSIGTNWVTTSETAAGAGSDTRKGFVENCSASAGCNVTFGHDLRRMLGDGGVRYKITKTVSYKSVDSTILVESERVTNPFKTAERVLSDSVTLYPGMMVCETMSFNTKLFDRNNSWSSTTVCVSALGDTIDPSGDNLLLDMNVKNTDLGGGYVKEVYAKPGDILEFKADYNPRLQFTYNLIPQAMIIDDGGLKVNEAANKLGWLFSDEMRPASGWNNVFSIQKNGGWLGNYPAMPVLGSTDETTESNDVKVSNDDVGTEISERASTNLNGTTQTTPSEVVFEKICSSGSTGDENCYSTAVVSTDTVESIAIAKVPYNFENGATINDENRTLFAGEKSSTRYIMSIMPKFNGYTMNNSDRNYATKVENASQIIEICYNDGSKYYCPPATAERIGSGTLVPNNPYETTNLEREISFVTPDLPAGTKIHIRVGVYPKNSGDDNNISTDGFSTEWAWSKSVEYTVAKRPSLQVVGGNIFTGGDIVSKFAVKKHLAGYNDYDPNATSGTSYVFGSWGELGLTALGKVEDFASGASLGYSSSVGTPGGGREDENREDENCKLNWLTISNDCKNDVVGNAAAKSSVAGIEIDKGTINSVVERIGNSDKKVEVSNGDNITIGGSDTLYYHSNGGLIIAGGENDNTIPKNTIKVVRASGEININSNIKYSDEPYQTLKEVPKAIIYTEGNIVIGCTVTQIDAVLIADNVDTCKTEGSDNSKYNAERNSTQLTIRGAIIANTLTPNRTYGAATGLNSIVPAEIINFDPTLYLWGGSGTGTEEEEDTIEIDSVYTRELAPRY